MLGKVSIPDSELQRAPSTPPPNKSAINLDKLDEVITRILEDAYLDDVEKQKTYEATFAVRLVPLRRLPLVFLVVTGMQSASKLIFQETSSPDEARKIPLASFRKLSF